MVATASNLPLLIPDNLFQCPRVGCGTILFISRNLTIPAGLSGGVLVGRCSRCETPYLFSPGNPSTTTSGTNSAGTTSLAVASGTAFSTTGAFLVIDSSDVDGGAEVVQTSGPGTSGAIPLTAPGTRLSHASGATVQTATITTLSPHSGYLGGG